MVRNIEEKTGKSVAAWVSLARGSGFSKHGEILALLRYIGRQFHPYEACNPRIRTVRFNTLTGSFISQHRIQSLADKLTVLATSPPPPPPTAPDGLSRPYIPDAPCPYPS